MDEWIQLYVKIKFRMECLQINISTLNFNLVSFDLFKAYLINGVVDK